MVQPYIFVVDTSKRRNGEEQEEYFCQSQSYSVIRQATENIEMTTTPNSSSKDCLHPESRRTRLQMIQITESRYLQSYKLYKSCESKYFPLKQQNVNNMCTSQTFDVSSEESIYSKCNLRRSQSIQKMCSGQTSAASTEQSINSRYCPRRMQLKQNMCTGQKFFDETVNSRYFPQRLQPKHEMCTCQMSPVSSEQSCSSSYCSKMSQRKPKMSQTSAIFPEEFFNSRHSPRRMESSTTMGRSQTSAVSSEEFINSRYSPWRMESSKTMGRNQRSAISSEEFIKSRYCPRRMESSKIMGRNQTSAISSEEFIKSRYCPRRMESSKTMGRNQISAVSSEEFIKSRYCPRRMESSKTMGRNQTSAVSSEEFINSRYCPRRMESSKTMGRNHLSAISSEELIKSRYCPKRMESSKIMGMNQTSAVSSEEFINSRYCPRRMESSKTMGRNHLSAISSEELIKSRYCPKRMESSKIMGMNQTSAVFSEEFINSRYCPRRMESSKTMGRNQISAISSEELIKSTYCPRTMESSKTMDRNQTSAISSEELIKSRYCPRRMESSKTMGRNQTSAVSSEEFIKSRYCPRRIPSKQKLCHISAVYSEKSCNSRYCPRSMQSKQNMCTSQIANVSSEESNHSNSWQMRSQSKKERKYNTTFRYSEICSVVSRSKQEILKYRTSGVPSKKSIHSESWLTRLPTKEKIQRQYQSSPRSMRRQTKQKIGSKNQILCNKKIYICRNGPSSLYLKQNPEDKMTRYAMLKHKALEAVRKRKVFMVYGRDATDIRKALLSRGWVEKLPPQQLITKYSTRLSKVSIDTMLLSNFLQNYDPNFVWDGKLNQHNNRQLCLENLIVNNRIQRRNTLYCSKKIPRHQGALRSRLKLKVKHWSSKTGLCTSLKDTPWHYIENVAEVDAPRTYCNTDNSELTDFVNDYLLTACTSLLRWIIVKLKNDEPIFMSTGKISINVMIFALNRCKEYLNMKENKDIDGITRREITPGQWTNFLIKYRSLVSGENVFKFDNERNLHLLIIYANYLLKEIMKYRPQQRCDGWYNIWIIKPSDLSMGMGIKMSSELNKILQLITKTTHKYVVQKYIEEPMLIYKTKFDIRQYYLITSTYPLEIWMYKDCFLKFCSQIYTLTSLHESIHLTNQAIQRHYKNSPDRNPGLPKKNICGLEAFKNYLKFIGKDDVWDKVIYPGMKKIIIGIMLTNQDCLSYEKNRFGLYGCDFILDSEFKPWLIEINNSPDLGPSYEAKICNRVLTDIIKVVIDHAENPKASTGKFECVYHQPTTPANTTHYYANLRVHGTALPIHYQNKEKPFDISSRIHTSVPPVLNKFNPITGLLDATNELCTDDQYIVTPHQKTDNSKTLIETKIIEEVNNVSNVDLNTDIGAAKIQMETNKISKLEEMFWSWVDGHQKNKAVRVSCITQTGPNSVTEFNGEHLDMKPENGKRKNYFDIDSDTREVSCIKQTELSGMTKLQNEDLHLNLNDAETYITHTEPIAMAEENSNNVYNLIPAMKAGSYMTYTEPNVIAKTDTDDQIIQMDLNLDKNIEAKMAQAELNAMSEQNSADYLRLCPDKTYMTYLEPNIKFASDNGKHLNSHVTHTKSNVIPQSDNYDSLDLKPYNDLFMTNSEPNAITKLDNQHLELSPEKEIITYMRHTESKIMPVSDNDILNLQTEKEICARMTDSEPNAITDPNGLHVDFSSDKKIITYMRHTEPKIMPVSDNDILNLQTEKEICARMTDSEPNAITDPNGLHVDFNPDKKIITYMRHIELKIMAVSDNDILNLQTEKEICARMTNSELNAITDPNGLHVDFSSDKKIITYMRHTEPKIMPVSDNDILNLQPEKEICVRMTDSEPNSVIDPNSLHVDFSPDKKIITYMRYREPKIMPVSDNNILNLKPEKELCAHMTDSELKAITDPVNDDYLNMSPTREVGAYIAHTESITIVEPDNSNINQDDKICAILKHEKPNFILTESDNGHLDLHSNKETYTYMMRAESNAITKTNNELLHSNKDRTVYAYMLHTEPNEIIDQDSEHLNLNSDKKIYAYMANTEPNVIAEPDNYDHVDLNADKDICTYMTHAKPNTITESDRDNRVVLSPDKNIYAYMTHAMAELYNDDHLYLNPVKVQIYTDMTQPESNITVQPDSDDHLDLKPVKHIYEYMTQVELDRDEDLVTHEDIDMMQTVSTVTTESDYGDHLRASVVQRLVNWAKNIVRAPFRISIF